MIELVQTCSACPEQYDAFENGRQVGYLRLRHGRFRVDCPTVFDETVLEHHFGDNSGCFSDEERPHYLGLAIEAIERWLGRGKMPKPMFSLEEITNA